MGWTLGKDGKTLIWSGGDPAPMLSGKQQKAQRKALKGGGLVRGPSPGVTVDQQGKARLPGRIDPEGTPPPGSGNAKYFGRGGQLPSGVSMVGGMPTAPDTSFAGPKDSIFSWPDGHKTVLMANGLSVDIPAAASHAEHGGGGGGGGGDDVPDLAVKGAAPQDIPFPQQANASSLGAPNQTWDWLLETLAAPGLLSPSLNLLGTYLAQNSTANDKGYNPIISQQNFGGLFGSPTSPPPFLSQPPPPFIGQTLAAGAGQQRTGIPYPQVSGTLNLNNLVNGQTVNPMAVGPAGPFNSMMQQQQRQAGGADLSGLFGGQQAGGGGRK